MEEEDCRATTRTGFAVVDLDVVMESDVYVERRLCRVGDGLASEVKFHWM